MIPHVKRHAITGLLFAMLLFQTGVTFAKAPAASPAALPNFHTVVANIYRGGAPTHAGLLKLRAMHIHTIIDLRIEHGLAKQEQKVAQSLGFTWINLPMGREAPTQKQVDTMLALLAKADSEPVFIHCQHGADRTGCMVGIYRVQVQGWTFAQAWTEMRKYGFKPFLSELKEAVRSRVKHRENG